MTLPGSLLRLNTLLAAVAPIVGVSIGSWTDRETWRIDFAPEATSEQIAAANVVLAAFDQYDVIAEDSFIKDRKIEALDVVALKVAFNHENRIRALESRPTIDLGKFKDAVKQFLD